MVLATALVTAPASTSSPARADDQPAAAVASSQTIGGRATEAFFTTTYMDAAHTTASWGGGTLSFPDEMADRSTFDVGTTAQCLVADGDRVYVGTTSDVRVIDVSDDANPKLAGTYTVEGYATPDKTVRGIAIQDGVGYFAAGDAGLQMADVTKTGTIPRIATYTDLGLGRVMDVAVDGPYAYFVDDDAGLTILDISDPAAPVLLRRSFTGSARHVAVSLDLACITTDVALVVVSVVDRNWPERIAAIPLSGTARIVMPGDRVYAVEDGRLRVVDLSYPFEPTIRDAGTFAAGPDLAHTGTGGDYLFVSTTTGGVYAVDIGDPDRVGIVNQTSDANQPRWIAASTTHAFTMGKNLTRLVVRGRPLDTNLSERNVAQSLPVAETGRDITRVRIATEQRGEIAWQISADGGSHWQSIEPGAAWTDVEYPGTSLLWRATLSASDADLSVCTRLVVDWRPENRAWTVDADGTGDAMSIRQGVEMAAPGDTLLLGAGTFTGTDNHEVPLLKDLVVRGAGADTTIIDCEDAGGAFVIGNDDSYRNHDVIAFDVQGVTIRNFGGLRRRGGIDAVTARVTVEDCVFTAGNSPAVYVSDGSARVRDSYVENCQRGVNINNGDGPTEVTRCEIRNVFNSIWLLNARAIATASSFGGTIESAVSGNHANVTITDCEFVNDNRANQNPTAGVINLTRQSVCALSGNRFLENIGTILVLTDNSGTSAAVEGNVFAHNLGPLLYISGYSGNVILLSNTAIGNIAGDKTLITMQSARVAFNRNIFAYNACRGLVGGVGFVVYNLHNDFFYNGGIAPPAPDDKDGNFGADPWFCNGLASDYTLQDGSPCLPANNSSGELVGALGAGCVPVRPAVDVSPRVLEDGDNPRVTVTLIPDRATGALDIDPTTVRMGGVLAPSVESGPKHGVTLRFDLRTFAGLLQPVGDSDIRRVYATAQMTDGRPLRVPIDFHFPRAASATDPDRGGRGAELPRIVAGIASVTPNPFNPVTTIRFGVVTAGTVDLTVFDVAGRLVAHLAHGAMPAGEHAIVWEADGVASGVYFARLTTPDGTWTRKLVIAR